MASARQYAVKAESVLLRLQDQILSDNYKAHEFEAQLAVSMSQAYALAAIALALTTEPAPEPSL